MLIGDCVMDHDKVIHCMSAGCIVFHIVSVLGCGDLTTLRVMCNLLMCLQSLHELLPTSKFVTSTADIL